MNLCCSDQDVCQICHQPGPEVINTWKFTVTAHHACVEQATVDLAFVDVPEWIVKEVAHLIQGSRVLLWRYPCEAFPAEQTLEGFCQHHFECSFDEFYDEKKRYLRQWLRRQKRLHRVTCPPLTPA